MNKLLVCDLTTGQETECTGGDQVVELIYNITGQRLGRQYVYNAMRQRDLLGRFRVVKLGGTSDKPAKKKKEEKPIRDTKQVTKDGWFFWEWIKTPSVICAERVLPYYDTRKFERIRQKLFPFACYFDLTDDGYLERRRRKCRVQIYGRFDGVEFKDKIERMAQLFEKKIQDLVN